MARESRFSSNDPAQRLQALSRWDNEGAHPVGPFANPASGAEPIDIPELTNAELVALRIRVIALENLLIFIALHGVRSSARSGSRDGRVYISAAGLYAAPTHNPRSGTYGRSC